MGAPEAASADLVSFVPRLTLEWLRDDPARLGLEREGTLAFVDISGFTAMSEQLARRGRAGAEEVTDVMNATFAALLDVAYADGGGLLKFGGDALLLLYEDDDHAQRAARAAFEMRRVLRTIGRPRTSAGTVTLRMHAGIHSGQFHFFLVGESHRELLVSGPAATRTVEMEAASEAGEIVVSPETAAYLAPELLGEAKGPGILLTGRPDVRGRFVPLPAVDAEVVAASVPVPLRAQLQEVGPLEGEHRNAAVAFLRFSGIDDTIRSEGADAAADALDVLVRAIQAAAEEHKVTFLESDVDRDGGRIILVAGAPQTFGDDEERLLRTVRTAVDGGLPFAVHVGVSRGRVFAGQVGAQFRRTYTLLGDTAALAARLMARAPEDEIWVSADAYSRGGARFAADELEPFAVKGKSEPVRAVVLGGLLVEGAEPVGASEPPSKIPFVDRERERAVLGAAVAPVRMGFGTLVELIGEPGIGKSRLAEELESHCGDMEKIRARCDQYESMTPYYPFRSMLRSLLAVELNGSGEHNRTVLTERLTAVDDGLGPWAPLLGAPLDVEVASTSEVDDLDPAFRRARLHGVVGKLLGELLEAPTLLLFEDVHWMDDASSELLRFLAGQLPTKPWLACTTRRPIDGGFAAAMGNPPLPALSLRLEPIPEEDAKTLARAAAQGRTVGDDELAALMARAGGNPLFLLELAAAEAGGDETEEMPETVEALLATRIDRLGPGDRALLRWASVLGVSFSGVAIAAVLEGDTDVAPTSEAWDRLDEFVEFDPDVPGAFRFRHALIRDAAYEGLSYRRRRDLHGRVAEVLEQQQADPETLSLHFLRAERWREAWDYSREAGRRAHAKFANHEAAEFYRRALAAAANLDDVPAEERARTWEALSDCLELSAHLEDAAGALAEARALTPQATREQVELMHKEGDLREAMGRYADALEWYDRALAVNDELGDEAARAHLRCAIGMSYAAVRFRQGAYDDCIRRCNDVVAEALEIDDHLQLARAYMMLHNVHTMTVSPERVAFRGLALSIFEDLGDLRRQALTLNNLGIDAYYEGDWDKALDVYARSRTLFERLGDVSNVAMAANNIGEILADRGRIDEAEALFGEVVETADASGRRGLATIARLNLGRAVSRSGRLDEGAALIAEAAAAFADMQAESFALEAEVRLAECDLFRGTAAAAALARARSVLTAADSGSDTVRAVALRVEGSALLQLRRPDEARRCLTAAADAARGAGLLYELALALDLLGDDESREILSRLRVEHLVTPPV